MINDAQMNIETKKSNCELHGSFNSRYFSKFNHWTTCPKCTDEKMAKDEEERLAKEAAEYEARKKAYVSSQIEKRIGRSMIPVRFLDRELNSFIAATPEMKSALSFARDYAESFSNVVTTGRSALFLGRPGTGKTHLAIGIGLHVMREGYSALFISVIRAVRIVKETWGRNSEQTESEAIATLTQPDLLILDEVGVQFASDTEKLILFDVLNERYANRRPTLLLSNLTLEEVKSCLGERIYDRLREDQGEVIAFTWDSHRPKIGKAA